MQNFKKSLGAHAQNFNMSTFWHNFTNAPGFATENEEYVNEVCKLKTYSN